MLKRVGIVFKIKVVNLADWFDLWHAVSFLNTGTHLLKFLKVEKIFSDLILQTKRWWEAVSSHSRRFCICHIAESLDWVEAGRSYFKGEKSSFFKICFVRYNWGLKRKKPNASSCWWKEKTDLQLSHFVWDADSCLYCTILSATLHLSNVVFVHDFDIRGEGRYGALLMKHGKLAN